MIHTLSSNLFVKLHDDKFAGMLITVLWKCSSCATPANPIHAKTWLGLFRICLTVRKVSVAKTKCKAKMFWLNWSALIFGTLVFFVKMKGIIIYVFKGSLISEGIFTLVPSRDGNSSKNVIPWGNEESRNCNLAFLKCRGRSNLFFGVLEGEFRGIKYAMGCHLFQLHGHSKSFLVKIIANIQKKMMNVA